MGKCRGILLVVLLLICALPVSAATGVISVSAPVGSELTLYRVGSLTEQGEVVLTEEFAPSCIAILQLHSPEAAERLAAYARRNALPGRTCRSNEKEQVCFDDLQQGVYLLMQSRTAEGFAPITPFLFSIPEGDCYAVEASPKQQTESQQQSTTPKTGDRTQVLLLPAAAAALFSVAGLLLCVISQKNRRP